MAVEGIPFFDEDDTVSRALASLTSAIVVGVNSPANDEIIGTSINEYFRGDAGYDEIYGRGGNDTISGGTENDRLFGGQGGDMLYGDEGYDFLYGATGNDELHGGTENDRLYGQGNDDILYGDEGYDFLYGGNGIDTLYGGSENDFLDGGKGADHLWGDDGFDKMLGGVGADTFHCYTQTVSESVEYIYGDFGELLDFFYVTETDYSHDGSVDAVYDFSVAEGDKLDVAGLLDLYNPLTDLLSDFVRLVEQGANTLLQVDQNGEGDTFATLARLVDVTGLPDVDQLVSDGTLIV